MKFFEAELFEKIRSLRFFPKRKKIQTEKLLNYIIGVLGVITIVLLSSFTHRMFIQPSVNPYVDETNAGKENEKIQVSVLNACGINGLAAETREYLRTRGFDVVEIGNYPETLNKSMICDRTGNVASAEKVAFALGINDSLIITEKDSTLFIRASIIIGNDFHTLKPFN